MTVEDVADSSLRADICFQPILQRNIRVGKADSDYIFSVPVAVGIADLSDEIYPPNSINISLSHNDAQVTLHFKGANKNFVPARDIM